MSSDTRESEASPGEFILDLHNNKEAVLNLSTNGTDFSKLEKLNISSCELSNIPAVVFTFKYLTELDISNNSIEYLPQEIGNLHNLLVLNLSDNDLTTIPRSLRQAYQLTFLNLSRNKFIEVPDVLYYGLRVIKVLDLSFNAISQFSDTPECLSNLVELRLSNNLLEKLPPWMFDNLCHLKVLDMSDNNISFDSEPVVCYYNSGVFESLEILNIENSNSRAENIQFLSYFKNLKALHLGNTELPGVKRGKNYLGAFNMDRFKNFHTVKYLYLQNVQISTLPRDIDCLENIEILNLSDNILSWLPESFCNLISLKVLYLTSNQLLFLPSDIGKLVNLKQIHLANNKLVDLPASFYKLNNLEYLDLYNNNIDKIDFKIFLQEKLCGMDLELNCIDFSKLKCHSDTETVQKQRDSLKKAFREQFGSLNCRSDSQTTKRGEEECGEEQRRTHNYAIGSVEDEAHSDSEDLRTEPPPQQKSVACKGEQEENWEEASFGTEKDELYDPHDMEAAKQRISNYWKSLFRNNFCPANGHMQSVMRTYVRNIKLAANNDIEEGQFDSD